MTNEELDRVLSSEEPPKPSPFLSARVLAEVRREAEEVRVPFPVGRFLVGIAACGVAAAAAAQVLTLAPPPVSPGIAPELCYALASAIAALGAAAAPRILSRRS